MDRGGLHGAAAAAVHQGVSLPCRTCSTTPVTRHKLMHQLSVSAPCVDRGRSHHSMRSSMQWVLCDACAGIEPRARHPAATTSPSARRAGRHLAALVRLPSTSSLFACLAFVEFLISEEGWTASPVRRFGQLSSFAVRVSISSFRSHLHFFPRRTCLAGCEQGAPTQVLALRHVIVASPAFIDTTP